MVIFFLIFFLRGGGGGGVWHFSATYNVVLLNDLHKHAPSINYFSHIFHEIQFSSIKKRNEKKTLMIKITAIFFYQFL